MSDSIVIPRSELPEVKLEPAPYGGGYRARVLYEDGKWIDGYGARDAESADYYARVNLALAEALRGKEAADAAAEEAALNREALDLWDAYCGVEGGDPDLPDWALKVWRDVALKARELNGGSHE